MPCLDMYCCLLEVLLRSKLSNSPCFDFRFRLLDHKSSSEIISAIKAVVNQMKYNDDQSRLTVELITLIYQNCTGCIPLYIESLKGALAQGIFPDKGNSSQLSFFGALTKKGLDLYPPEAMTTSKNKRVYRMFGSHRFLEVRADKKCNFLDIQDFCCSNRSIAGRKYGLFWAKHTRIQEVFVMFAESGIGIPEEDEMSAHFAASLCIPRDLNKDLSVEKYMKRMKLCFSDTTPTLTLEKGMLEHIEDIHGALSGNIMTDGCGLLSREALDWIWTLWNHQVPLCGRDPFCDVKSQLVKQTCLHSSFLARIGGVKGMFVVDDNLGPELKVLYRRSQHKFTVPLTHSGSDDCIDRDFYHFHHTVDVVEWDEKPPPATLNRGLVQILEERGVPKNYFVDLARKEIDKVNAMRVDRVLFEQYFNTKTFLVDSPNMFHDNMLLRMIKANVPLNEPVMHRFVQNFVNAELDKYREKVSSLKFAKNIHITKTKLPFYIALCESIVSPCCVYCTEQIFRRKKPLPTNDS